ncbi:MAG: peptidoglycan-binding domain-containing protein [bacterium]|nr:peptidoglycan-binding domain-containing protein [bacterium]
MNLFTKGVISTAVALLLVVPTATHASGLTSAQVDSVLGLLQSFNADTKTINAVQEALNHTAKPEKPERTGVASTTLKRLPPGQVGKMACITLSRNLGLGSRGDDVKKLQEMLSEDQDSDFHSTATGFFGPLTAKAMIRFQMHNGIATSTTGYIGSLTRGFFERHCGKGLGHELGEKKKVATTTNATTLTTASTTTREDSDD